MVLSIFRVGILGLAWWDMLLIPVLGRDRRVFISLRPAWTTEWIVPLQLSLSGSTLKDPAKVCLLYDSRSSLVDRKH